MTNVPEVVFEMLQGPFVAAFASSNLGDVSPNIKGPKCQKTGLPCDINHSTCPTAKDLCVASGPGRDMFESTAIIANRLFKAAWVSSEESNKCLSLVPMTQKVWEFRSENFLSLQALWSSPGEEVKGPIKIVHQYVDMPNAEADIVKPDGTVTKVRNCLLITSKIVIHVNFYNFGCLCRWKDAYQPWVTVLLREQWMAQGPFPLNKARYQPTRCGI